MGGGSGRSSRCSGTAPLVAFPAAPRLPPPAADIYEQTARELAQQGLGCECLGGGRLSHRPEERKIHVYGYSVVSGAPGGRWGGEGIPTSGRGFSLPTAARVPVRVPLLVAELAPRPLGSRRVELGLPTSPRCPPECPEEGIGDAGAGFASSGMAPAWVPCCLAAGARLSCPWSA